MPTTPEEVAKFILAADKNNDYKLDYREFYAFVFATATANASITSSANKKAVGCSPCEAAMAASIGVVSGDAPATAPAAAAIETTGPSEALAAGDAETALLVQKMRVDLKREIDQRKAAKVALMRKQEVTWEQMQAEAESETGKGKANPRYCTAERKSFWDFQRMTLPQRVRVRPEGYEPLEDRHTRYQGKFLLSMGAEHTVKILLADDSLQVTAA